jgi:subtilisin family serine protease
MRPSARVLLPIVAACSVGCSDLLPPQPPVDMTPSPYSGPVVAASEVLQDRWIVWLHDGVSDVRGLARSLVGSEGEISQSVWRHTVRGFAATFGEEHAARLRLHPEVRSVRSDVRFQGIRSSSWGLDRVDQRGLPLVGGYEPALDGSGIDIFVVDTGIRSAHIDFTGRAVTTGGGFDAIRDPASIYYAEDCWGQADPNMDPPELQFPGGHGTHVAGTVGGFSYGVAPGVRRIVSVRVLDCDGWGLASHMLDGIDWISANKDPLTPSVANLSLGAAFVSDSLFESVEAAIVRSIQNAGVLYIASAGNEAGDACDISPARMPEVITVAASDSTDTRPQFSNYGSCVDIFAPGADIISAAAYGTSDTSCVNCWSSRSGTSMSAPHVTGIAAQVLQRYGGLSPAEVRDTVVAWATLGAVANPGAGSPNRLAFTPRLLSIAISGPDTIADTLTYQWRAESTGGDGSYTHEWSRRHHWPGTGPGSWEVIGTDSIAEPVILDVSPHFDLRVRVWSGFQLEAEERFIFAFCTEPCLEFAPTRWPTWKGGGE